jgi:hypothetical protein
MSLFSNRKSRAVQSFILKLVNSNCLEQVVRQEDARTDRRVNLVMVVAIVPIEDKKLQVEKAFSATTKEFSGSGLSVVLESPQPLDEVVLGFRFAGAMTFIRAEAKHRDPMGGGFFQVGFQLLDVLSPGDYPELQALSL